MSEVDARYCTQVEMQYVTLSRLPANHERWCNDHGVTYYKKPGHATGNVWLPDVSMYLSGFRDPAVNSMGKNVSNTVSEAEA